MTKQVSSQAPQWMVVYSTYNLPEAHIVAGRLESEGIAAMVHQMAGANAMGIRVGRLGEITVLVKETDYAKALEILEPIEPEELPDSTDAIRYVEPEEDEGE